MTFFSLENHASAARVWLVVALVSSSAALSGCASTWMADAMASVTPYKLEIVQGNVVTSEQLAQLKPGMTRDAVREVLGAPLLADIFHADRWDYPFSIRRKGAEAQRRNVVIGFAGNVVKTIEAPDLPSEREFVAGLSRAAPRAVPKLELTEEERKALPAAAASAPAAASVTTAPVGAKRDYPPLEPAR